MTLLGHIGTGPAEDESTSTSDKNGFLPVDAPSANPEKSKTTKDEGKNAVKDSKNTTGATCDISTQDGSGGGVHKAPRLQRGLRKTTPPTKSPRKGNITRLQDPRPAKKRAREIIPDANLKKHREDTRIVTVPGTQHKAEHDRKETKTNKRNVLTRSPSRVPTHGTPSKRPKNTPKDIHSTANTVPARRNTKVHTSDPSNNERMAARQAKENIRNLALTSSRHGKNLVEETIIDSSFHPATEDNHEGNEKQSTSEATHVDNSDRTASICNKSNLSGPETSSSSADVADEGENQRKKVISIPLTLQALQRTPYRKHGFDMGFVCWVMQTLEPSSLGDAINIASNRTDIHQSVLNLLIDTSLRPTFEVWKYLTAGGCDFRPLHVTCILLGIRYPQFPARFAKCLEKTDAGHKQSDFLNLRFLRTFSRFQMDLQEKPLDILLIAAVAYLATNRMHKRMWEEMRKYISRRCTAIMSVWNTMANQVGYASWDSLVKYYATLSDETLFLAPLDADVYAAPEYHRSFIASPETVPLDKCSVDIRTRSNAGHTAIRSALREFACLPNALYRECIQALSSTELDHEYSSTQRKEVRICIHKGQEALQLLLPQKDPYGFIPAPLNLPCLQQMPPHMLHFCTENVPNSATDIKWIVEHLPLHEWPSRVWTSLGKKKDFEGDLLRVDCQHFNLQMGLVDKDMYLASTKSYNPGDFITNYFGVITYESYANREQFDQETTKLGTRDIYVTLDQHLRRHIHVPPHPSSLKMNTKYAATFKISITPYSFAAGSFLRFAGDNEIDDANCTFRFREYKRVGEAIKFDTIKVVATKHIGPDTILLASTPAYMYGSTLNSTGRTKK